MPVDVLIRPFTKELDFEEALAKLLSRSPTQRCNK